MKTPGNPQLISARTLQQWNDAGSPFYLIDILPPEHFAAAHLPGAANACVFEVTFMEQVASITQDKQARIVVYGASGRSMEAPVAVKKLQREGFSDVYMLKGGIEDWTASGFSLAEEASGALPTPQNRIVLESGTYRVNAGQSLIEWVGRNPNTKHDGTIDISSGEIQITDSRPSGTVEIDMTAIKNRSLAGDRLQPVLLAHLQSDDFFFTDRFPTAVFTIREARLRDEARAGAPNLDILGTLTLRGITAEIGFDATVSPVTDGVLIARAHFDLDRTRWNIIYGSARFFEHLGMHLVFDTISIELKIVANRQ